MGGAITLSRRKKRFADWDLLRTTGKLKPKGLGDGVQAEERGGGQHFDRGETSRARLRGRTT